jgi:hypothetical protein
LIVIIKDKSVRFAAILCLCVTFAIIAFLYNRSLDLGFAKSLTVNEFISYITLISAIFGGVFAYKILRTTLDQRDVPFMPFLSVTGLNPLDSDLEVRFRNNGLGPAIDVYWESYSLHLPFGDGKHRTDVIMPGDSTSVSRPWADPNLGKQSVSNFKLAMTCKDQMGNKYNFIYSIDGYSIEFVGTQKNGVALA